jgi:SAM-dependent methyltransferase
MSFSEEWDEVYRASGHLSVWPWSDVVSYVHRYAKPSAGFSRVLEFGCGPGANIPFFLKLGVHYFAMDGSAAIVDAVKTRYPEIAEQIAVGDFTQIVPFDGSFDLVLDRASLIHNTTAGIAAGLDIAFQKLRIGGKFIGIDWFSEKHTAASQGDLVDQHTRSGLPPTSSLFGIGKVHFCDEAHLIGLLEGAGFEIERLEHKRFDPAIPHGLETVAVWNFVAVKAQD